MVQWLAGDFSTPRALPIFYGTPSKKLSACRYLINNYGPISVQSHRGTGTRTCWPISSAGGAGASIITHFLIARAPLQIGADHRL